MNARTKFLFGYIFPALGGLFVTYLYNVVDGIFVGQGVGAAALGAVNIGVPFITFVIAIAAMFPMGGASKLSAEMREMSRQYLFFYSAFSVPALMSTSLSVYVRNDGSPTLAFAGMCAGDYHAVHHTHYGTLL